MSREWYQFCKDCREEYGYSDFSHQLGLRRGYSRPERCPDHLEQHALEIKSISSSHFALIPRQGPRSILGVPYLGGVDHGSRELSPKEIEVDGSVMDIGITEDDIKKVYADLERFQVLIVVGPTGSGKSTYLPYRLINPLPPYSNDFFTQHGPIIVTQPRIQATRGIPDTVGSKLLGANVGPGFEIGFRHGDRSGKSGGENYDRRNRLVFVTDGTLLNWIADGKTGDFGIIMIDEAHERSCNIDLILGLLKRELRKYSHLRLIIASATIDADKFVKYYGDMTSGRPLNFEGQRTHGYDRHWWDGSPVAEDDLSPEIVKKVSASVAEKVVKILATTSSGGILGFLPGQKEIDFAVGFIKSNLGGRSDVKVFPLYTALGVRRGQEALQPLNKVRTDGHWVTPRRVVIATNVAETSVTVPDVVYVVDSGLIKQTEWNSSTCRQELITRWHSKDGCKQRWGRAGRAQHGHVYTLYTEERFKSLADHTPPEITRECLEDVLLTAKAAGVRDISKFSWIDPPQETEIGRATNVIRKRGLVDPDEDLTEEGMELYRVARQVTQFIDRYDYSSTRRALDLATLLVLADRYACLTEAATVLAMMPRMGNSLYWRGDGILLWDWDRRWDLLSKDRVAQIHRGLQAGCNDDLDFACKLFSLYERHSLGSAGSGVNDWCHQHFINEQNLVLVNESRAKLVMLFMRGKKDLTLRPLEFSLVPRVRFLMAVAWPDRILPLRPGTPVRFVASDSGDTGIVSRLSCGVWHDRKHAIIGMMNRGYTFTDGGMRECPTANFLVEVPEFIPANEPAAIAPIFAGIRACIDPQELQARFLADQYAPIGSRVQVEPSSDNGAKLVRVLQTPGAFVPNMTESVDEDGDIVSTDEVYEHRVVDTSIDSPDYDEDEDADEVSAELDVLTDGSATEAKPQMGLEPNGVDIPLLKGQWFSANRGTQATIEGWITTDEQPVALLRAIGTDSNESTPLPELHSGTMIDICLERDVREMDSGRLAGFMARAPGGLMFPVSVADLSISLNNPGLEKLKGRNLKVTVIDSSENDSQLRVSLLSIAEADLDNLVSLGEAKGRVVNSGRPKTPVFRKNDPLEF